MSGNISKKENSASVSELFSDFLNNFQEIKIERKRGGGVSCHIKHQNKIYYLTLCEVSEDENKK